MGQRHTSRGDFVLCSLGRYVPRSRPDGSAAHATSSVLSIARLRVDEQKLVPRPYRLPFIYGACGRQLRKHDDAFVQVE